MADTDETIIFQVGWKVTKVCDTYKVWKTSAQVSDSEPSDITYNRVVFDSKDFGRVLDYLRFQKVSTFLEITSKDTRYK